jgi:hypothetical protein
MTIIITTDMDDVLVHISTPWVRRSLANTAIATAVQDYITDNDELETKVLSRTQPYIQRWLVDNCHLPESMVSDIDMIYRADPTFYDDLPPC